MIELLFSFFNKAGSLLASAFIALGLISSPSLATAPIAVEQPQKIEESAEVGIKSVALGIEIEKLRNEIEDLKKVKSAPQKINQEQPPPPIVQKKEPKTYTLPSGAIVDENGKILNEVELNQKRLLEALERQRALLEKDKKIGKDQVVKEARRATTKICSDNGCGSGFIFEGDGYILTNAHVVEGVQVAKVFLDDGSSYESLVIGRNEAIDLAILHINSVGLPTLVLGDSDESALPITSDVFALGYPLASTYARIGADVVVTAEPGNITARRVAVGIEYLQTNANINSGNSGGPLINGQIEVVGITTWKLTKASGSGFAIPINTVRSYIPRLKAGMQAVNTPITPPAPPGPPQPDMPQGSTRTIPRSVISSIMLNPNLTCDQLGISDKSICWQYKLYKDKYNWTILDGE